MPLVAENYNPPPPQKKRQLAPDVLVILPLNKKNHYNPVVHMKPPRKEEKIASLVFKAKLMLKVELTNLEVLAYMEMARCDLNDAIKNAGEDFAWSANLEE
jgi:hypothetical protein